MNLYNTPLGGYTRFDSIAQASMWEAFCKHVQVLENVREMWTEVPHGGKKKAKPVNKEPNLH
jgi:hypothetical protein